jgi:choline dehydrogenase-like flavoprotein
MAFDFDVIIIGTGFGATVTATQLALLNPNKKKNILMLERGVWWFTPERAFPAYINNNIDKEPIQYWPRPDHRRGVLDLLSVVRTNNSIAEAFRQVQDLPQPLYRYNSFDEIDILTASGVGGGSLVYSNVTIEPHFDRSAQRYPVMENWPIQLTPQDYVAARGWMETFRGTLSEVVTRFPPPPSLIAHLKALPDDQKYLYLGKCRWLKEASEALGKDPQWMAKIVEKWEPLKLQIIEYPDNSTTDVNKKTYCERQGRCFLGCLPGARHTLNKTLVNNAPSKNLLNELNGKKPPVQLKSLAEVDHIEALGGGGWKVLYDDLRFDEDEDGRKKSATAPIVVLAAGCLSSTELLLRSRTHGLTLSSRLGHRFSSNGDYAGFIDYRPQDKNKDPFHLHFNTAPFPIFSTRGPINASHVMFQDGKILVNFEDATVPPMLAPVVRSALDVLANAAGRNPFLSMVRAMWQLNFQDISEDPDPTDPKNFWTEHEMLQNTFFFNLMGRDEARGVFDLDESDQLTLSFEGGPLAKDPVYQKIEEIIKAMVDKMGGQYFRFPFWSRNGLLNNNPNPERKFVTVHPLGGCPMGRTSTDGVVDTKGRVFSTDHGSDQVHQGLYLADASVVPGPVAVNPTLTIVALAQKIASQIT